MIEVRAGDIVIVGSGQVGTVDSIGKDICVLLANGNLWYGFESQIRVNPTREEQDACPLDVDRFAAR